MRVLVLGIFRTPHQSLMDLGHELVLFLGRDKLLPTDLKAPYSRIYLFDKHEDAELIALAQALHQVKPFQAVCAFMDGWQSLANTIADVLNLPRVVDPVTLDWTRNKPKMRARLAEAGVEATSFRLVESREDIARALREIGPTCILKPVDSEASSGVAKLTGVDDIDPALRWFHDSGHRLPALMETFLTGDEYSVEGISEGGTHHLVAITRKYKDEKNFVEVGHVVPAPLPEATAAQIRAHVCRMLDALGFKSGPSHTELILTEAGPRIVETHTRMGGDRITDLVKLSSGIDLCELAARQAIGESIADRVPTRITYQQSAAVWFCTPSVSPDLVLSRIEEEDTVRSLPGVHMLKVDKQVGDRGGPVLNSFGRSGFVIATGEDPAMAIQRARTATERLRFFYKWEPAAPAAPSHGRAG